MHKQVHTKHTGRKHYEQTESAKPLRTCVPTTSMLG